MILHPFSILRTHITMFLKDGFTRIGLHVVLKKKGLNAVDELMFSVDFILNITRSTAYPPSKSNISSQSLRVKV